MSKSSTVFAFAILFVVYILAACASASKSTPAVERYNPSFDFVPPASADSNATPVTFAVVGQRYTSHNLYLFNEFYRHLLNDFQEVLQARSFGITGPFVSFDEMTYPQKKNSDLIITPEIDFSAEIVNEQWGESVGRAIFNAEEKYKCEGTIHITSYLNLVISESLTGEKMWTKNLELSPINIDFWTGYYANTSTSIPVIIEREDAVQADLARALEEQYNKTLQAVFDYLHPEEMALVKKQSQELREKKVY